MFFDLNYQSAVHYIKAHTLPHHLSSIRSRWVWRPSQTTSVYSCESSSPPLLLKRSWFLKADVFSRMRHNISENTHLGNISLSLWFLLYFQLTLVYQLLYFLSAIVFWSISNLQRELPASDLSKVGGRDFVSEFDTRTFPTFPYHMPTYGPVRDQGKLH